MISLTHGVPKMPQVRSGLVNCEADFTQHMYQMCDFVGEAIFTGKQCYLPVKNGQ
jgi:hypothetical protein